MKKRLLISCIHLCLAGFTFATPGPHAVNDTVQVAQNSSGNIINPISGNDGDSTGGILTITILSGPQHGMASVINGNQVSYTPTAYFYGTDSFSYSVCDTSRLCDTAEVYLYVVGHDYPPVAVPDSFAYTDSVDTVILYVLANDYDPENFSFSVTAVINTDTIARLGTLILDSATGEVLFIRTPYSCGTDSFEYVICDTLAACDTGTVTVTINCPDNVFLPQGISPNGDGKNDLLIFTGLEYFEPASLIVFNRYGNPVYQNDNYQNDWGGTSRDNGQALPDGTYFYVLQLSNHHKYVNYLIINH